jgi:hypothetical protein
MTAQQVLEARDEFMDEFEVARLLKQSVQTLRNQRCSRRGPAYHKIGRSVRYKRSDLLDYLNRCRIDPEAV